MKLVDFQQFNLPDSPGVYFFQKGKDILYVGKATSLKDRVKSYFAPRILSTRSPLIAKMLEEAERVEFIQTDSVLEALILEANEIKKNQPYYNSKEKDDKSYNFVTITKEEFPKVTITRGSGTYGPFPYGGELKEALKIIRKIFPYRDVKCKLSGKPCFNAQIGLCPGPCAGWISKLEYRKIIRNIKLFFEGKKETLIQDVALIKADVSKTVFDIGFRIEAYDIAHISGTNVVGVMTVVENGEVAKSQYRKFKIRADKNDDTKNLKEVLSS